MHPGGGGSTVTHSRLARGVELNAAAIGISAYSPISGALSSRCARLPSIPQLWLTLKCWLEIKSPPPVSAISLACANAPIDNATITTKQETKPAAVLFMTGLDATPRLPANCRILNG